jgi:nitroreductase
MTTANGRTSDYPIDKLFLERWSPRAFTGEAIPHDVLMTILEAGRWAPSSYNSQPWRFLYALRDTADFSTFLDLLVPFNQSWAKQASALVFMVSKSTMQPAGADKPIPSHSHSFDTGAAWAQMALQAHISGWATHSMTGVDFPRAFEVLNVPEGYRVEAAVAIGRQGDASLLPEQLAAREKPSGREPLATMVIAGGFKA